MTDRNQEVISTLHDLIETCRDGWQEFTSGAESIEDGNLQSVLQQYSRTRQRFIDELTMEMRALGEARDEAESESITGAIGRGILEVKSEVLASSPSDILAECEVIDSTTLETYQQALEKPLPDETRALVQQQYRSIVASHDTLSELCRRAG